MMDKRFDSNYIEKKWYKRWLESGAFASNNQSPKEPYVIMMPPPNCNWFVTYWSCFNIHYSRYLNKIS